MNINKKQFLEYDEGFGEKAIINFDDIVEIKLGCNRYKDEGITVYFKNKNSRFICKKEISTLKIVELDAMDLVDYVKEHFNED